MSDIAKLYEEVMSSDVEKTAADMGYAQGATFDADFFEKVASGDEDAVGELNSFVEEARAAGHSDDAIEAAIGEAAASAGVVDVNGNPEGQDEYELAKHAAYYEGAEKAVEDVLFSDFAKEAGVTAEDVANFELGGLYGQGYSEARADIEDIVTKIAQAKAYEAEKTAGIGEKLKDAGRRYMTLLKGGEKGTVGAMAGKRAANSRQGFKDMRKEHLMSQGTRAGTAAGVGAAGYGGYRAATHKRRDR
jgi:hypothetical protein